MARTTPFHYILDNESMSISVSGPVTTVAADVRSTVVTNHGPKKLLFTVSDFTKCKALTKKLVPKNAIKTLSRHLRNAGFVVVW